jgi:hypothetical protein
MTNFRHVFTLLNIIPFYFYFVAQGTAGAGAGVAKSSVGQDGGCPFVQGLHANLIRFITKEGFHR